jgi:tetratricopeptide (TPR) repeat protein
MTAIGTKRPTSAPHNYVGFQWTSGRLVGVHATKQRLPDTEKAIELDPNSPDIFYLRGQIFEALGRRKEAISEFHRAVGKKPNHEDARSALKRLGAEP